MAGKINGVRNLQNRTDTFIGAGARVDGNIAFRGVLRIQGYVHGNVSCDAGSDGMTVVDQSGTVTGTIIAPHILVRGRVQGVIHSPLAPEVEGECEGRERSYDENAMRVVGVIEPSSSPRGLTISDRAEAKPSTHLTEQLPDPADVKPLAGTLAARRIGGRFGDWPKLGGAAIGLIAAVTVVMASRETMPVPFIPPVADVSLDSSTLANKPPQSGPVASFERQNEPEIGPQILPRVVEVSPDGNPMALGNPKKIDPGNPRNIEPVPRVDRSEIALTKAVTVKGIDPNKPAGVIFVVGREPAVVIKKMRQDAAESTRIDVTQGAIQSIAIASNEILRVAQGRDINIFYQGRKVAAQTIASGAWINFVPQSPDGARE